MLPIALQLYSVRFELSKDFEKTLETVASYGYVGVEFAGLFGRDPADVKKILDRLGLKAVSAHVPLAEMEGDIEKVAKDYSFLGCVNISIPSMPVEKYPGGEEYDLLKKEVAEFAEVLGRYGLTLSYHNHDKEFEMKAGRHKLDILYEDLPELSTQIDTCWAQVGGVDPAEYVKKYSGRCPTIHLKDYFGTRNGHMYSLIGEKEDALAKDNTAFEYRPLGSGLLNVKKVVDGAKKAGAEWIIVEQDGPTPGMTSFECIKKSIDYLKGIE